MRNWIIVALTCVLCCPLRADPGSNVLSEVPFQFRDGLLWVEVSSGVSSQPLHFLLDTGANASVIHVATARRLGLVLGPKVTVLSVCTMLPGFWPVRVSAKAGGMELPGELLGLDLSELSQACSHSVDGLIGADFFRGRIVQIDYQAQKVRLLRSSLPASAAQTVPLEIRRCGFRVSITVNNGHRQWVRLDTGCATALQWVTTRISTNGCTSKLAVGLAEVAIPQTVTSVRLGRELINGVATGLHTKEIFPGEAGLLGNGLLARFGTITIDAKLGSLALGSADHRVASH